MKKRRDHKQANQDFKHFTKELAQLCKKYKFAIEGALTGVDEDSADIVIGVYDATDRLNDYACALIGAIDDKGRVLDPQYVGDYEDTAPEEENYGNN